MTWNSTMSSGYSSLEEDSEEYFFTARTSFFKKPSGKITEKKVRLRTHTHTLSTQTPCKLLFLIKKFCVREALKSSCLIQIWASFRTALKKISQTYISLISKRCSYEEENKQTDFSLTQLYLNPAYSQSKTKQPFKVYPPLLYFIHLLCPFSLKEQRHFQTLQSCELFFMLNLLAGASFHFIFYHVELSLQCPFS